MDAQDKQNTQEAQETREEAQDAQEEAHEAPEARQEQQDSESKKKEKKDRMLVVGIGASAGGLEALENFFANVPPESNMAFIVIQHLDPHHKSLMDSLLKKFTTMNISGIQDGMQIELNCIYLNPPDKNVLLRNGVFHLSKQDRRAGMNLPIDYFLRSLAQDQGNHAVCVILSGTGSDGTLGLKAIKETGGMTMAQEEEQAQYAGMPRSAIETGLVDVVLPVERMSPELQKYAAHPYIEWTEREQAQKQEQQLGEAFQKIFAILRKKLGHDFSAYKETTIRRRIERRMAVHRIERIQRYVQYLQESPHEVNKLFKDLLISVTNFFREPEAFQALKDPLAERVQQESAHEPIRVWIPGCATGEEAYSLAILLTEILEAADQHRELMIFASDLDPDAIDYARRAVYPENIAADVSPERLRRFFTKEDNSYRVKKQLREAVVFAVQNLIDDPPFSRLDLVSCRNLLIYLKTDLQRKIIPLFHYTLKPGGLLFLGTSESIGEFGNLFKPLNQKSKIYRHREYIVDDFGEYPKIPFFEYNAAPHSYHKPQPTHKVDLRKILERIVLKTYAPPCVIINDQYQILYFSGQADYYLRTPDGEANFNIFTMARAGLHLKLRATIHQAFKEQQPVISKGITVKQNGESRIIDLIVRPLSEERFARDLLLIVFQELPYSLRGDSKSNAVMGEQEQNDPQIASLEQELQITKESLQSTIEELETSNEELRSTNEELQSVNEELQSSNEELTTSKEELQSTNEELATVNTELQHKVDELAQANNDINNLLASTEIATIFLDTDLHIQRFTPTVKKIFNLIDSDIGRPISDITSNLNYDRLYEDAKTVLDTLERKEIETNVTDNKWYAIRIFPYRTVENMIDGVVLTFIDITRQREASVAKTYAENIVETIREPLLILDGNLRVKSANKAFYRFFQVKPQDMKGKRIYDLGDQQWDIPQLRRLLEQIIPEDNQFEDYEVEHDFPTIGRKTLLLNARRIHETASQSPLFLLAMEDVTTAES